MRKFLSFVLIAALLATMSFSYAAIHGESSDTRYEGADGEYVEINKKSYGPAEAVIIKYKFNSDEKGRMVVVYEDKDGDGHVSDGDVPIWHQGAGDGREYDGLFPLTGALLDSLGDGRYKQSNYKWKLFDGKYVLSFRKFETTNNSDGTFADSDKNSMELSFTMANSNGNDQWKNAIMEVPETTALQGTALKAQYSLLNVINQYQRNWNSRIALYDSFGTKRDEKILYELSENYTKFKYIGELAGTVEFDTTDLEPGTYSVKLERYGNENTHAGQLNTDVTIEVTVEQKADVTTPPTESTSPSPEETVTPPTPSISPSPEETVTPPAESTPPSPEETVTPPAESTSPSTGESGTHPNLLPSDLLSSREKANEWLHDEDKDGTTATYTTEDGEYVMIVPPLTDGWAKGNSYVYSIQQIPYDSYTLSFDFQLIDGSMHFLMGVGENGVYPWTQLSFEPNFEANQMMFKHRKNTGSEWLEFSQDTMSYYYDDDDSVENIKGTWFNLTVEVTADAITPYLNGYEIAGSLKDTAGFLEGFSYFGFRAPGPGDSQGFKIKNLAIYEGVGLGLGQDQEPTEEPTKAPATNPATPTKGTETPPPTGDISIIVMCGAIALVLVVTVVVLRMKKYVSDK